jgi:precorrin-6A/cobalt-precorrin-6A reductase
MNVSHNRDRLKTDSKNQTKNLLILGGTTEARKLAEQLVNSTKINLRINLRVITSLAGRTTKPTQISGELRIGGFGGVDGLIDYLQTARIDFLIDATHPFAAQISKNGAIASQTLKIPHLRLARPAWQKQIRDDWIEVQNMGEAANSAFQFKRVLLTIGRQQLNPFLTNNLQSTWFLIRSIEIPDLIIPNSEILCDRPPYSLETEKNLLLKYQIDAIVSKNSGGMETYSKVLAARELRIPIIMVQRPILANVCEVENVEKAIAWLENYRLG